MNGSANLQKYLLSKRKFVRDELEGTYKEGEGLLELGNLLFGEGVSLD